MGKIIFQTIHLSHEGTIWEFKLEKQSLGKEEY